MKVQLPQTLGPELATLVASYRPLGVDLSVRRLSQGVLYLAAGRTTATQDQIPSQELCAGIVRAVESLPGWHYYGLQVRIIDLDRPCVQLPRMPQCYESAPLHDLLSQAMIRCGDGPGAFFAGGQQWHIDCDAGVSAVQLRRLRATVRRALDDYYTYLSSFREALPPEVPGKMVS